MVELNLKFTHSPKVDTGSFKLVELPADLAKVVESSTEPKRWMIKGQPTDDAVLCTEDKTYSIRTVVLSNSVLVVTRPTSSFAQNIDSGEDDVVIRDTIHDILELQTTVPRLQKLNGMLRGAEFDEGQEEGNHDDHEFDNLDDREESQGRVAKRKRLTLDEAREMLQASDAEISRGLKDRRVLILNGELRPIAPTYLLTILELLLNYLVSLSLPHQAASIDQLVNALEEEHEIKRTISMQVMEWFGGLDAGLWIMDVSLVMKEVGVGILRSLKDDPVTEIVFMEKWRNAVGDTFADKVSLELLKGNYLVTPSPNTYPPVSVLVYFPTSELPTDPAMRFNDLFLTRPRWKAEDITPFLGDIAVDNKERDKLLLKFARAVTDSEGTWYTARAKHGS